MSILEHPKWEQIRPYIKIEEYQREGGSKNPRVRIELLDSAPTLIAQTALDLTMACVACGATIHPFRARLKNEHATKHIYFAAACPLEVSIGCSRGRAAKNEYIAIKSRVGASQ